MDAVLEGRRIIVTGAATGIGAAAVQVFADAGARVAAVYHRSPPPAHLADVARWWQCDARRKDEVTATFAAAAEHLGGLDVLLHAAGLWQPATPDGLSEEDLDFLLDTNVKGTVFANQAAFELMKPAGGRIINMGSSEGVHGNPFAACYSLSKAAVHGWTRAAARSWGPQGITVNALAPAVESPGADRFRDHIGPEGAAMLEASIRATRPIKGALGDGALGDASTDLGPMLVFLAGEGSHFITGQLLAVDGGMMMMGA